MGHCKRGRFIAIQAYLKKQEKNQINNLTLHLKLEKEEMKKPSVSRRKEILKIRAEINAKETKETIAKINKIRNESGEITTDNTEIQRIMLLLLLSHFNRVRLCATP